MSTSSETGDLNSYEADEKCTASLIAQKKVLLFQSLANIVNVFVIP